MNNTDSRPPSHTDEDVAKMIDALRAAGFGTIATRIDDAADTRRTVTLTVLAPAYGGVRR